MIACIITCHKSKLPIDKFSQQHGIVAIVYSTTPKPDRKVMAVTPVEAYKDRVVNVRKKKSMQGPTWKESL